MRIRIINSVVKTVLDDDILPPIPSFVDAEVDWLDEGPSSVECRYDDALCVPPLLERVKAAAIDGVDGIVINCFMDPGLQVARELTRVPVSGPAESAMLLASSLGQRFSVILPAASGAPIVVEQAVSYGVRDQLASVRSVEMPVAELSNEAKLIDGLLQQAELAWSDDDAHVVILGCTGMSHVTETVKREFDARGHDIPVIDPTLAAIGMLVAINTAGVHHSGRTYAVPSWKAQALVGA